LEIKNYQTEKMAEYRSKKGLAGKTYKKPVKTSKSRDKYSSDEQKTKQGFSKKREQSDSSPKKQFGEKNYTKKSDHFKKESSKLPQKIKKSYSDYEKEEKQKPFKKNSTSNYSKSKNSSEKDWDEKKPVVDKRKSFGSKEKQDYRLKKEGKKSISQTGTKRKSVDKEIQWPVRLNRYIAFSGICSRREADEMIQVGEVKVNGVIVTEMGTKVNADDRVEVGGQGLKPEKKVYILLNKPKDFVSTVSDPHADKTVLDLVKHAGPERIYPVGRLDKNTTGVMLLTNDGELTKKLTHPSYNKKKVYHVVLDKPATKANLQQIIEGFVLEDGFINADAISFVNENDKTEIGIEIHSGRNRIVRRIFEHLGLNVVKLDRVYFAGLTKKNVPRGKWRYLSDKEVNILKMGAYE
jgi:23S rRNA pseudouridine2605 synthase